MPFTECQRKQAGIFNDCYLNVREKQESQLLFENYVLVQNHSRFQCGSAYFSKEEKRDEEGTGCSKGSWFHKHRFVGSLL